MKKQSIPLYVLAAAILASAVLIAWRLPGSTAGTDTAAPDPAAAYRLEKLNEVGDMVLNRQVVPEDYLRYLDGALAQAVAEYNGATAALKSGYSSYAEGVAKSLYYGWEDSTWQEDYNRPDRYYRFIDRLSTLALFSNISDLSRTDPETSYSAAKEGGGSAGLWAWALHEDFHVGEELARSVQDYFTQIDALLDQIDAARAAFA